MARAILYGDRCPLAVNSFSFYHLRSRNSRSERPGNGQYTDGLFLSDRRGDYGPGGVRAARLEDNAQGALFAGCAYIGIHVVNEHVLSFRIWALSRLTFPAF